MENPQLKDMIINVDEEQIDKEKGKCPNKTKKAFTKPGMQVSKVDGLRVPKADGLKMLPTIMDTFH